MSLTKDDLRQIGELMDERFTKVNEKFAKIDERFVKMDERFAKIDERFAKIDKKFEKMDENFAKIDGKFAKMDEKFAKVDARFDALERRLDDQDVILNKTFDLAQDELLEIKVRIAAVETEIANLRDDLTLTKSAVVPVLKKMSGSDIAKALAKIADIEKQLNGVKKSLALS